MIGKLSYIGTFNEPDHLRPLDEDWQLMRGAAARLLSIGSGTLCGRPRNSYVYTFV